MQWCLAEAKRESSRKCLQSVVVISISQDVSRTRFLLRYRCASPTLEVQEGILDLRREVNTPQYNGADALRRATLLGIEAACKPTRPPGNNSAPRVTLDVDLFQKILPNIVAFAADGAADEQLAGRELTRTLGGACTTEIRESVAKNLPNLKAASGCEQALRNSRLGLA